MSYLLGLVCADFVRSLLLLISKRVRRLTMQTPQSLSPPHSTDVRVLTGLKTSQEAELELLVETFFDHITECRYWPRIARHAAANLCLWLVESPLLVESAKSWYSEFAKKLQQSTSQCHSPDIASRKRFISVCRTVLHRRYAAIKVKVVPISRQLAAAANWWDGVESKFDLLRRINPPLLRSDVFAAVVATTDGICVPFIHLDLSREQPIVVTVPSAHGAAVRQRVKNAANGIAPLFIEVAEGRADQQPLVQASERFGLLHQSCKTTVGAVALSKDKQYWGITTAHGFLKSNERKTHEGRLPKNDGYCGVYLPDDGVDVALVKLTDKDVQPNMFNFTPVVPALGDMAGKKTFKNGAQTGITMSVVEKKGCIIPIENTDRAYNNVISFAKVGASSQLGDCGALYSVHQEDTNKFQPIAVHFGHTETLSYGLDLSRCLQALIDYEVLQNFEGWEFFATPQGVAHDRQLFSGTVALTEGSHGSEDLAAE